MERTCWKLLTVLPMLRPTSGNFLGPKTMAATPAITTSSGTPNPKSALQVKPWFLRNCLRGAIETLEVEYRDEARCCLEVGDGIGIGIEEENETQFNIVISILLHFLLRLHFYFYFLK